MPRLIVLFFLLVISQYAIAQQTSDSIRMTKLKGTYEYFQGEKEVHFVDLKNIMKPDENAYRYLKYANSNRFFKNFFFGSAILGVGISLYWYNETGNTNYLISGAIFCGAYFLITIPLKKGLNKNTKKAIEIYNKNLNQAAQRKIDLKLQTSNNGLGIAINF